MEKYRELFEELPIPAFVMTREGDLCETNEAFKSSFPSSLEVATLVELLKDDVEKAWLSSEKRTTIEKYVAFHGDDERIYRVRISRLSSEQSPETIVLLTDITESRRHAEEIERLAAIVESSEDAIFSVSNEKKIMSWNNGAERIFGYPGAVAINSSIMKLVPKGLSDEFSDLLESAQNGHAVVRHETVNCHYDGHLFPVSMSLAPLLYQGNVIGVTIVSRDISLRRETEERLAISHRQLKSLMHETVESLSTAHEKRDLYTAGHQRTVSMISCCIADEMNLSHDQIEGIRIAGLLHDIGKVCIPMAILSKPARLTREEMALMMLHPVTGFEIVKNVPFPWPVKEILLQHHERMDGTGYPSGLRGDAILLESRILAVADVLEAMSSHRPYRPALGLEVALAEIAENSDTKYDKDVCEVVMKLFDEGSMRLEQGKLVCSL